MSLEELKPRLLTLPTDGLRRPAMPVANAVQEASDLLEVIKQPNVQDTLLAVGQAADFVDDLEARMVAMREAQSLWQSVRDQTKSSELIALEQRASALRSELLAAGRFNLRGREPQASLDFIRGGETVDDLVQDLFDLATLFEKHQAAFARDRSFDFSAAVAEAREVGQALSSGISEERLDPEPTGTRELRDRAFTFLDDLVSEIRAAGRYAYRHSPAMAKLFTSRYRRRQRRRAQKSEPQVEVIPEELSP